MEATSESQKKEIGERREQAAELRKAAEEKVAKHNQNTAAQEAKLAERANVAGKALKNGADGNGIAIGPEDHNAIREEKQAKRRANEMRTRQAYGEAVEAWGKRMNVKSRELMWSKDALDRRELAGVGYAEEFPSHYQSERNRQQRQRPTERSPSRGRSATELQKRLTKVFSNDCERVVGRLNQDQSWAAWNRGDVAREVRRETENAASLSRRRWPSKRGGGLGM